MDADLLRATVELVRDAGRLAAARFAAGSTATEKADGIEVTPADLEAERFLRRGIAERFPDDGGYGEEAGGRITDPHGGDVLTGEGSAPISNGRLHDPLLQLLAGIPHGRDFRALLA